MAIDVDDADDSPPPPPPLLLSYPPYPPLHSPSYPPYSDIVVCHTGLAGAAKNAAPEGSVLIQFTMFMNDPNLKKLIVDLSEDNEIISS